MKQFETAYQELLTWCRARNFAGYDPFDGLNSRLFQSTPLARIPTARLIWTQILKRSPLNLRPFLLVPKQRNAKGIALFALAALADYRRNRLSKKELEARKLLDALIEMRIRGYSGAAWGYNFDWQSRNFFAPLGTPTIVPTAFAVRALSEGYEVLSDRRYLEFAKSACDFIVHDLATSEGRDGLCFSYVPTARTRIWNASLLAAEALARVGQLRQEEEYSNLAKAAARYVVQQQNPDGSWSYGDNPDQAWIDNFHTAYILYSLSKIIEAGQPGGEFSEALEHGYRFWRDRFFLADGWPKYYDDRPFPADAHATASAIVTFLEFTNSDGNALAQAKVIASWAIENLRAREGYFFYQRRRFFAVKTPHIRWTQAWMLYALARLLEELQKQRLGSQ